MFVHLSIVSFQLYVFLLFQSTRTILLNQNIYSMLEWHFYVYLYLSLFLAVLYLYLSLFLAVQNVRKKQNNSRRKSHLN